MNRLLSLILVLIALSAQAEAQTKTTAWERLAWYNGGIVTDAVVDAFFYPLITNHSSRNQRVEIYRIVQLAFNALIVYVLHENAGIGASGGWIIAKFGGVMDGLYYPITALMWGGYYKRAWREEILADQATWLWWTFAKWGSDPRVPIKHQAFIAEMIITYTAGTLATILFDEQSRFIFSTSSSHIGYALTVSYRYN